MRIPPAHTHPSKLAVAAASQRLEVPSEQIETPASETLLGRLSFLVIAILLGCCARCLGQSTKPVDNSTIEERNLKIVQDAFVMSPEALRTDIASLKEQLIVLGKAMDDARSAAGDSAGGNPDYIAATVSMTEAETGLADLGTSPEQRNVFADEILNDKIRIREIASRDPGVAAAESSYEETNEKIVLEEGVLRDQLAIAAADEAKDSPPIAANDLGSPDPIFGGETSPRISKVTGLPMTELVSGYIKKDGTYVAPYLRSRK